MPHGQPDFGMYAIAETIYRLSDMGELAVRLGSIVTHDRRGDVIWFDDFEGTLNKWDQYPIGTGAKIEQSADSARNGGRSCKLTTGNAINDYAMILKWLPYPILSKIGFEISFTLDAELGHVTNYLYLYDGTKQYRAYVDYHPDIDKLYYLDEDGTSHLLAENLDLAEYSTYYHTWKLVVDLATKKYVRLILDEKTYDLSSYGICSVASATLPCINALVYAITHVAANKSIYVDDAIITQNEP